MKSVAPPNRGFTYRERIAPAGRGLTVLEWLASRHPHSTTTQWEARVRGGEVRLGDRVAAPDDRLRPGDWLVWERPGWIEPPVPLRFEPLFEDGDLVAVNKPSGLPTVPGGGFLEHTLLALVRRDYPEASPMHRLGRGTSGLVVFGLTALARQRLQSAWRERRVDKTYLALVSGIPAQRTFSVVDAIGPVPHPKLGTVFAACPTGKPASSHVSVVARRGSNALVEVRIDTGRPHQIRIHLAAAGHPLVGDPLYRIGGKASPDAVPGDEGYLLHAARLGLAHPRTGLRLELECEPPTELRA